MPVIEGSQPKSPQALERAFLPKLCPELKARMDHPAQAQASGATWLSGLAVITDVQVQAGDEQMVGRLFHIKVLKVLAEAVAAVAAAALAATKCLGPGLLGTGSRWGGLYVTEKNRKSRP